MQKKTFQARKSEKVFVVHEYKEEILLEEAFEPMKKARLSRYLLSEIEDYLKEAEMISRENWDYLLQKKKWIEDKFIALEKKIGIGKEPEKYEEIAVEKYKTMDAKEAIETIKEYLKVNADMEELIKRMLGKIANELKLIINSNLILLEDQLSSMEFQRHLKTEKIYQLNNVHTDWDKQVTYFIKTNTKEFQTEISEIPKEERILKVKDYSFEINKLYEEISVLQATLLRMNEAFVSNAKVKQIEKNNDLQQQINRKLFWLTAITLVFVVIQTVIGIFSLL
jgi:5-carboxymethyl-2-hydroxymuconate isomerase